MDWSLRCGLPFLEPRIRDLRQPNPLIEGVIAPFRRWYTCGITTFGEVVWTKILLLLLLLCNESNFISPLGKPRRPAKALMLVTAVIGLWYGGLMGNCAKKNLLIDQNKMVGPL